MENRSFTMLYIYLLFAFGEHPSVPLILLFLGTQERVRKSCGKRATSVRATGSIVCI